MGGGEILLNAEEIKPWGTGGGGAKGLAGYLAAEGELLQVVEAGGSLDIGERIGRSVLQSFV
jgi:hypothetical protein